MKYRPDEIERLGLIPHAVYGGYVHSFKVAGDDRTYDANLLDEIFIKAQYRASEIIGQRNALTAALKE